MQTMEPLICVLKLWNLMQSVLEVDLCLNNISIIIYNVHTESGHTIIDTLKLTLPCGLVQEHL